MGKITATHQLKFLAAGAAVVFFWFVFHLGFRGTAADKLRKITHPGSKSPVSASGPPSNVLVGAEADEYCKRYRLKPFPAEKVKERKIYDLLLANTEVEMLEIRLGEMYPYVDYFVILESDKTFTDKDKPLFVQENWERFAPYHDKMIRRTMDLASIEFDGTTWNREMKSRNAMYDQVVPFLTGNQTANHMDVLLVSDIDEIPKPEILKALRNCEFPARTTIHSAIYYYSFQWLARNDWPHPQATTYRGKETILPDDLRHNGNDFHFMHGGWHCSYCFSTVEELVKKISSFSHAELNRPEFKVPSKIVDHVRYGNDLFDRGESGLDRVEHNYDIPTFLKHNTEKYGFMVDRDAPNGGFTDYIPPAAAEPSGTALQ